VSGLGNLLPPGFVRIRNFGFLANRNHATLLPLRLRLLVWSFLLEDPLDEAGRVVAELTQARIGQRVLVWQMPGFVFQDKPFGRNIAIPAPPQRRFA
jgi:hypothetical protein